MLSKQINTSIYIASTKQKVNNYEKLVYQSVKHFLDFIFNQTLICFNRLVFEHICFALIYAIYTYPLRRIRHAIEYN